MDYIFNSSKLSMINHPEPSLNENIQIYIKDKITNDINLVDVLRKMEIAIPLHLISEVDSIFVGIFEDFQYIFEKIDHPK